MKNEKIKKYILTKTCLILGLLSSIGYLIVTLIYKENDLDFYTSFLSLLLLVIFTFFFTISSFTNPTKKKKLIFLSGFFLICYNVLGILFTLNILSIPPINQVEDFTGKSLIDVMEWSEKNDVVINQEYEYSDMVEEYKIISQSQSPGTNTKKIKSLNISISDGPNPDKEMILANMVTWDSDRVLKYIKKNYLTNVQVEFVESDKLKNTVIEQSVSGNIKRSDEVKLTFSKGDENEEQQETTLMDLTNKTKFEAEFYLKQYDIPYEIKTDFSKKIKKGRVKKQSPTPGTKIKDKNTKVIVTISKGEKIVVPDLRKYSLSKITKWIIKNHLKLEFTSKYDEKVKENKVIEASHKKNDVVEVGTLIKITLSKGQLIMPKFEKLNDFYDWADKYEIPYEEKHQFSDDIKKGDVIEYSHKTGDIIKNNDTIIVTISDGKEIKVPNVIGLSKDAAIEKLKNANLGYSTIYKSSSKEKDTVIEQSIQSGSKVSENTTITIIISNGKRESNSSSNSTSKRNSSSTSNSNSSSNNNVEEPQEVCTKKTYTISREFNNIFRNYSGYSSVVSALKSYLDRNYPDANFRIVAVDGGDASSGSYISGIKPGSTITSCNESPYVIEIAK